MEQGKNPKVCIIILNYNNWLDTIECLESLLKIRYDNYQIIIVDNCSNDKSDEYICRWASGNLDYNQIKSNVIPDPISKPLRINIYNHGVLEKFEFVKNIAISKDNDSFHDSEAKIRINKINKNQYPLILIKSMRNRGFGAGNNIGIDFAQLDQMNKFIWILNNDVVVDPESLLFLVKKSDEYEKKGKKISIIGSKIFDYSDLKKIQSIGGIHNKWLGTGRHLGQGAFDYGQYDNEGILNEIDYIMGAAMFVNFDFIRDVGKMKEDYFLYYEDFAWSLEGKKRGWQLGFCWKSKIYHKNGATIGSHNKGNKRSILSDYYQLRNRIKFTRDYYPLQLFTVLLGFLIVTINRIIRLNLLSLIKFHIKTISESPK